MIEISETAARKIRTLMAKQGIDEGGLRVGVKGGGCSGLSYTFAWERQPRLGDEVFEGPDGAKIFVDKKSLLFLNGTVLDYDTNLISKGVRVQQPEREDDLRLRQLVRGIVKFRRPPADFRLRCLPCLPLTLQSAAIAAAARRSTCTSARSARRS